MVNSSASSLIWSKNQAFSVNVFIVQSHLSATLDIFIQCLSSWVLRNDICRGSKKRIKRTWEQRDSSLVENEHVTRSVCSGTSFCTSSLVAFLMGWDGMWTGL